VPPLAGGAPDTLLATARRSVSAHGQGPRRVRGSRLGPGGSG